MDPEAVKHMFNIALNPQNAVGVSNQAEFDKNVRKIRDTVKHITGNDLIAQRANEKSLEYMHDFLKRTENW
jgi:hypothetical protein